MDDADGAPQTEDGKKIINNLITDKSKKKFIN